ncbi:MAG: DUF3667 domain-containing protein [Gelidibacter sp.]
MPSPTCLNCNHALVGPYCSNCGQKADTRRITFKNFLFNDILHGTFSIERGMLYTAKQSLRRPGTAALDYIAGKRKPYYNLFLLSLFLFGLILFLRHFYEVLATAQGSPLSTTPYKDEASIRLNTLIADQSKLVVFLFVPLAAVSSCILFRRRQLNLSEHFILSGMVLLGILLISAIGHLLFYLNLLTDADVVSSIINIGTPLAAILYVGYGYVEAFGTLYSRWGMVYRIALFFILLMVQVYLLLLILIGFVTNWKFGTVTLSPFG